MTITPTENAGVAAIDQHDEQILRYLGLNPNNPADRAAVAVCRAYDFDPILKHVVVIPQGGVYITRDGYLHVAHRSGQLDGIVVEKRPVLEDGEWTAEVSVWRKDMGHPFRYPGRYSAQGSNKKYAPEMALKAAESHALRRAFDVVGLPSYDEQRPERGPQPGVDPVAPAPARMAAILGQEPADPDPVAPAESPYLDTKGPLARHMFGALGDLNIRDRDERLTYVSKVLDREVASSSELTDDDARCVILQAEHDLEQPFPIEVEG